jgi:Zn-dependent protease with chaperone function
VESLLCAGIILLLPVVGLASWARVVVRQPPGPGWYRLCAAHLWLSLGLTFGWWLVVPWLRTATAPYDLASIVWWFVLPPTFSVQLLHSIIDATRRTLRGLPIDRSTFVWLHLFAWLEKVGQLVTLGAVLEALQRQALGAALGCLVLGLLGTMYLHQWRQTANLVVPEQVPPGALSERAQELAARIGVETVALGVQAEVVEVAANAFAWDERVIVVSETLVRELSRREVDTVLAHELGHLSASSWADHPLSWLAGAGLALVALVAGLSFTHWALPLVGLDAQLWALPIVGASVHLSLTLVLNARARQAEFAADAVSVQLTRDAEALVSALLRLDRLNLQPTRWGWWTEWLLTHPSTERRIRAVTGLDALPAKWLTEPPAATERYELERLPNIVWNATEQELRAQTLSVQLWLGLVGIPLLIVALVGGGWLGWVVGVTVGPCAWLAWQNGLIYRYESALERRLRQRLRDLGVEGGTLVALAPHETAVVYDQFFHWDYGLLFVTVERLAYVGERTWFACLRADLTRCELRPGVPNWLPTLAWVVQGPPGDFRLRPAGCGTVSATTRATPGLLEPNVFAVPEVLRTLRPAPWGTVPHEPIANLVRRKRVFWLALTVALTTAGLAWPLGWELWGDPRTLTAVALSVLLVGFARVPLWRQRLAA